MTKRQAWVLLGALVAIFFVLPVGWWLVSPLFINRSVDEALPSGDFVPAEATDAMQQALSEPDKEMQEAMPGGDAAQATVLARGDFYPVVHEGEGKATVYQLAGGSRVLRFEDFSVLNGPDLHVWLVPVDPVPNTVGVEIGGYADLGKLKGNVGNQNYELPAGLDLSRFQSVVIWCQPFRVPFSAAPLRVP